MKMKAYVHLCFCKKWRRERERIGVLVLWRIPVHVYETVVCEYFCLKEWCKFDELSILTILCIYVFVVQTEASLCRTDLFTPTLCPPLNHVHCVCPYLSFTCFIVLCSCFACLTFGLFHRRYP